MSLVKMVMSFTPYGVMALMTRVVAGSSLEDILNLGKFIVVSDEELLTEIKSCYGRDWLKDAPHMLVVVGDSWW